MTFVPVIFHFFLFLTAFLCLPTQHVHIVFSLMQEPFQSLPVVWLVHEDTLGQHIRSYAQSHDSILNVIEDWRVHFNACAYVVFPDSYLPVCTSLNSKCWNI